ncbi:MAG: phytanoyl-CoA dioxygenase family protein [Pseudomonadota bacterium]
MLQEPILDLTRDQIKGFVTRGFVRVNDAFPRELAAQARRRIWRDLPGDGRIPATWPQSVERSDIYRQKPFREVLGAPRLQRAIDQLVGPGRWQQPNGLGPFVIRYPSKRSTRDTGWHIDPAFPPPDSSGDPDPMADPLTWRVNIHAQGRGLLMLMLFSDVGPQDGPTRLRAGSHLDVAPLLEPAGPEGVDAHGLDATIGKDRVVHLATGKAGTVYLCHPFLVHAAQRNQGKRPRFLAHVDLPLVRPLILGRTDGRYAPVEWAIRKAICWYP